MATKLTNMVVLNGETTNSGSGTGISATETVEIPK